MMSKLRALTPHRTHIDTDRDTDMAPELKKRKLDGVNLLITRAHLIKELESGKYDVYPMALRRTMEDGMKERKKRNPAAYDIVWQLTIYRRGFPADRKHKCGPDESCKYDDTAT
jgi:hypothetical protein